MKKYSMLGVVIRHPLKTLIRTIITFFVLIIALPLLGMTYNENDINILLIMSLLISAFGLKRRYNKGIVETSPPKRRKSLLFGMLKSMNSSIDNSVAGFGNAFGSAFTGSSSAADEAQYRAQQADKAARARWDAIDRQKKAEWDARNAALRGKDKAAYQYQNEADYWRGQSKR